MVGFTDTNDHTDMRYINALLLDCELLGCDIIKSSGWSPTFWRNLPSLYSGFTIFNLLKPNGFYTHHQVLHSAILHGARCALSDL
jgi:hypothetical protein